jgi:transglutaminase-like putative cysteine protease
LTSAFDTVTQRIGVCRDFAHLGIALCRALGIPARYVSAYAWRLDPPDFHAVFEAFLNGPSGAGWHLFDPTRMSAPNGLVRIGIGRDAAEVAFCTAYEEVESDAPQVWISGDGDATGPITPALERDSRPADPPRRQRRMLVPDGHDLIGRLEVRRMSGDLLPGIPFEIL